MIKIGDTVMRKIATSYSLLPKGTVGEVVYLTQHCLTLREYTHLLLPVEDFVKIDKDKA